MLNLNLLTWDVAVVIMSKIGFFKEKEDLPGESESIISISETYKYKDIFNFNNADITL